MKYLLLNTYGVAVHFTYDEEEAKDWLQSGGDVQPVGIENVCSN